MNKKILIIFSLIILISPLFVFAEWELEANYPTIEGRSPEGGLVMYMNYIVTLLMSIVGISALGAVTYAGLQRMLSDSVFSKEESNKWLWGALSGVILALVGFILLYAINPVLVQFKLPNMSIVSNPNPPGLPPESEDPYTPDELNDSSAWQSSLEDLGYETKDLCTYRGQLNCVALNGLQQDTFNDLRTLIDLCNDELDVPACENLLLNQLFVLQGDGLIITGGTECEPHSGGSAHCTGDAIDLRDTNTVRSMVSQMVNDGFLIASNPVTRTAPDGSTYTATKYTYDLTMGNVTTHFTITREEFKNPNATSPYQTHYHLSD